MADVAGVGAIKRAVAIGGGHGTARTLRALRLVADDVSAVVTVADDGGSSGRLRRDLGIPPPGDLRMALTALAHNGELAHLGSHRFSRGELAGHSLGNLMLAGLLDQADGDLVAALARFGQLLDVRGRVLPCATQPLQLHGTVRAREVVGQASLAATSSLERVWIEPSDAVAPSQAVAAITEAELVVLGPGSIYTSLLPNLLVPGIASALAQTPARIAFVTNLREQPGETEGLTLSEHLAALFAHVPESRVDVVVAHAGADPSGPGRPLTPDVDQLAADGWTLVRSDVLDGHDGHDPHALAQALVDAARLDIESS